MCIFVAVELSLLSVFLSLRYASGGLELLLSGNTDIPTDGSATLVIPYIGTHEQGTALICRHGLPGIPPSAGIDKWFFVDENGDEDVENSGSFGFSVSRGQTLGDVRLERIAGASPLEGIYKCFVSSTIETVTVLLYWPLSSLKVTVGVLWQTTEGLRFTVSCRSEGGTLVSSSLTGPQGELLGQLTLVDNNEVLMRGTDSYSLVVERSEGKNGDVFNCTANTRGSAHAANVALSVAPDIENAVVTQVPSSSPALNISWSLAADGSTVTNYTLYYTSRTDGREDHNGSVSTAGNSSGVIIENLLGDGRTYSIVVEAHSLHLSSFSETLSYTPCVVSWLSVSSKSSNSLLLTWERPEYFTASLRGLLYYESLQQQAGSEGRWLYVDSSDRLQPITGLEESTNYSISMAVLDGNDRLCVFNEPLMVQTGLGQVQDLVLLLERNQISLTWSPPPRTPNNAILNYTVSYSSSGNSRATTTTTADQTWKIRAKLGDMYTVTVTPNDQFGTGESLAVTIGLDYKPFQIRIDSVERCGDILGSEATLTSVMHQLQQILSNRCNCVVQIGEARFDCPAPDEQFILLHGTLFSPVTTNSAALFSQLEAWVSSGQVLTISSTNAVSTNCLPDEMYAESQECVGSSTTPIARSLMTQDSGSGLGVGEMVGVAAGAFIVGVLATCVLIFIYHLGRKRYRRKQGIALRNQAHGLMSSTERCKENPRYVSADRQSCRPLQRELPLLPLVGLDDTVTFTNPLLINGGAPEEITNEHGEAYETVKEAGKVVVHEVYETVKEPGKVVNPMYEGAIDVKGKRDRKGEQYEDVEQVKTVAETTRRKFEDEYVTMQPTSPAKPNEGAPH